MRQSSDKVYGLLSVAMKAGSVASGAFAAGQAIGSGKAFLAVIAEDASGNTKKKFKNSCEYYQVPFIEFGKKEQLGHCIGKDERSILAVTNESLAGAVMRANREEDSQWRK